MTIGTDLADEVFTDPVHTPVQIHHKQAGDQGASGSDLVDVLTEMVPVINQGRAARVAQYPFSEQYKRGRIESGPLTKYAGETFNTCIVKHEPRRRTADVAWVYTVFVREHIGTRTTTRRDGSRSQIWTWRYHMRQTFWSVQQAYDLFERLCQAQRNEQELDDPYHTPFMSGPETPWDPSVLADMMAAQESRDRASEQHAANWNEPEEWHVINLDGPLAQ